MNTQSIQFRLTFWYTVLIVAASIAFGAYTYYSFEHRLYTEMQDMLARRIIHLREDVLPDISRDTRASLAEKIEEIYSPEENDRFIRISEADGTVLYISGTPREKTFEPKSIPLPSHYSATISEPMKSLRASDRLLLIGYATKLGDADYILEMGTTVAPIIIALHKLVITLLFGLPIIILIAVVGGSVLVRRALQPVEAMRATAEHISFSNLQNRLPLNASGDAIEHLGKTLNQMLERLDRSYQQASRFSADASHELRTPLAVIRSEIESLLRKMDANQVDHERIVSILEEVERLSGTVEGLFSLARLDAGEARIDHNIFDLSDLTKTTFDQMRLVADEKNISVTVDAPAKVFVMGDASRMKQIIVNLFDNAIKYTMPGGSISLYIKAKNSKAILIIEDNGIGIPQDALPHVFERFYRADKVRSRGKQGAGLGLSIVHSICQAHGGTVSAASVEDYGTTLTVELPLADKQNS